MNGVIFILASILTGLLLIYYNKAHLFFLLIQEKVKEFDRYYNKKNLIERIELASMRQSKLISKLANLVEDGKLKIHPFQYLLANFRTSLCIKLSMIICSIVSLFLGIGIFYKNVF